MAGKGKRVFQIGEYWLSKQARSEAWCRTWYDEAARQTKRASLGTADLREAQERLTEWCVAHLRPENAGLDQISIAEALRVYWEEHGATIPSADNAMVSCRYWLDFFEDKSIAEAAKMPMQRRFHAWLAEEHGLSGSTINRVVSVGRAAVNRAWKNGEIASAPYFAVVEEDEKEPLGRPLTIEETARLIEGMRTEHSVRFCLLMIGTLARPDAVIGLSREQCDLEHGLIRLNPAGRKQTKKYRPVVKLPPMLRAMIKESGPGPLLTYGGKPIRSVKTAFRGARRRAGLGEEVNPYSFRHTLARWMRKEGVPGWEVAAQLGHKGRGLSTTEIYAPFDPSYLDGACAAIERFACELRVKSPLIDDAINNRLKNFDDYQGLNGGRYWARTSDPSDVNTVLYQLS